MDLLHRCQKDELGSGVSIQASSRVGVADRLYRLELEDWMEAWSAWRRVCIIAINVGQWYGLGSKVS